MNRLNSENYSLRFLFLNYFSLLKHTLEKDRDREEGEMERGEERDSWGMEIER
jgi:hypothetical protein